MYDLSRLSGSSFERVVRALCFSFFGPGGTVYSQGADGGRDFTFEGEIKNYPGWDGYLVVQAKYFEKAGKDTTNDIDWITNAIKEEEADYIDANANRRKPKYFIVATNVGMSGADGRGRFGVRTGGYTKIDQLMKGWINSVGIEDYDIWPHDKIIDLLANNTEIRKTYAAWITPGDVLSAAIDNISHINPEFYPSMRSSLKNSLKRDQFVRLKDAGDVADAQIRTSQVFIDLPIASAHHKNRFPELAPDFFEHEFQPDTVISRICELSKSNFSHDRHIDLDSSKAGLHANILTAGRIVLLGGPGQGKSTASTFLAQLYRANLLTSFEKQISDPTISKLVPEVISRAFEQGIDTNIPLRYPILVSLPRFADSITAARMKGSDAPSLLTHISADISRTCDRTISKIYLRNWISNYPWIVILDGLDEVPLTGERSSILNSISAFESEVFELSADVLMVVTTRPQGYNQDFEPQYWDHWILTDLSSKTALSYAEALGKARYPQDSERRDDLMQKLVIASTKEATSRLMISPLQVSIMHMIADTGGSIPAARWSLFDDYFDILRKREKAKGGETQKALEKNWSLLAPIHQRAGLILQSDSENVGSAGAKLSYSRFEKLLNGYLVEQGHEGSDVEDRVSEIMEVALNRLVLLSTREEGSVSFDVRSLQEYMAAAALTSNTSSIVEERLAHIAGMAHWRHVFLIAASRCFAEPAFHHLRSIIVSLPRRLDTYDSDALIRNGARLALEMFVDGIGNDHPISRRQLAIHAIELLDLGFANYDERLTKLIEVGTKSQIFHILEQRTSISNTDASIAAWTLVLNAAWIGHEEAEQIVLKNWPKDNLAALNVLEYTKTPLKNPLIIELACKTIASLSPGIVLRRLPAAFEIYQTGKFPIEAEHYKFLLGFNHMGRDSHGAADLRAAFFFDKRTAGLELRFISLFNKARFSSVEVSLSQYPNAWTSIQAVLEFVNDPNAKSLGATLNKFTNKILFDEAKIIHRDSFPWLLGKLIARASDVDSLRAIATDAAAGAYGDTADWKACEQRLVDQYVSEDDVLHEANGVGISRGIANVGCPLIERLSVSTGVNLLKVVDKLVDLVSRDINEDISVELSRTLKFAVISLSEGQTIISLEDAKKYLASTLITKNEGIWFDSLDCFDFGLWKNESFLRSVSEAACFVSAGTHEALRTPLSVVIDACITHPQIPELIFIVLTRFLSFSDTSSDLIKKLPCAVLRTSPNDNLKIKLARICLALIAENYSAIDRIEFREVIEKSASDAPLRKIIAEVLYSDIVQKTAVSPFLQIMLEVAPRDKSLFIGTIQRAIKKCLDSRVSQLNDQTVWVEKLSLSSSTFSLLSGPEKSGFCDN